LLQAAIESVGNAAHHWRVAQAFEQQVGAAAHMQDDGQLVLLRELELGFVKQLLLGQRSSRVELGHKPIQANFTHGYQAWVVVVGVQGSVELRQMRLGGVRGVERVNAQGINILLGMGQQTHGVKVGRLDRRDDALRHTRLTTSPMHGCAVSLKLGGI
jgi:hypothetical protein